MLCCDISFMHPYK